MLAWIVAPRGAEYFHETSAAGCFRSVFEPACRRMTATRSELTMAGLLELRAF